MCLVLSCHEVDKEISVLKSENGMIKKSNKWLLMLEWYAVQNSFHASLLWQNFKNCVYFFLSFQIKKKKQGFWKSFTIQFFVESFRAVLIKKYFYVYSKSLQILKYLSLVIFQTWQYLSTTLITIFIFFSSWRLAKEAIRHCSTTCFQKRFRINWRSPFIS